MARQNFSQVLTHSMPQRRPYGTPFVTKIIELFRVEISLFSVEISLFSVEISLFSVEISLFSVEIRVLFRV